MVDAAALAELLIAKRLITEGEYLEAVTIAMEREAKRYQDILSERLGTKVTLA
jgi:hypothetical protein